MKRFFWLLILIIFSSNGYANSWERLPTDLEINTALDNLKDTYTIRLTDGSTVPMILSPVFKYHYRNYRHRYNNSLIPIVPHLDASGLIVALRYKSIPNVYTAWNRGFDLNYDNNKWVFNHRGARTIERYATLEKALNTMISGLSGYGEIDLGFASPLPDDSTITLSIAPSLSPNNHKIGLMPAIDGARALISYKGNPNKKVLTKASCNINGSRIFFAKHPMKRLDAKYGKNAIYDTPQFTTDSQGKLDVVVFLRLNEKEVKKNKSLKTPGEIQIVFWEEGKKTNKVSASIKVGLGLRIYGDKMINISAVLEETPNHVYYAFIKSSFYKNFDLLAFQDRNNKCSVAKEVVANIRSVPINYEADGSHMLDGVSGKADIVPVESNRRRSIGQYHIFSKAPKGVVLTVASWSRKKQPYLEHKGMKLPAIDQKKNGFYTKGFYGLLQLAEQDERSQERIPSGQVSLEPRILDGKVFILTVDEAQNLYASLACMLNAQNANQLAILTLLETIPPLVTPGVGTAVGKGISMTRSLASALCNLASGEYKEFAKATVSFAGKKRLEYLVKSKLIPKLLSGKSSDKFIRLIGENVSDESRKRLAKVLETAYSTGESIIGAATYELPSKQEYLKKEIEETIIIKTKAFNEYTKLATEGGEGDILDAQKRWREANDKLKKLKSQQK